MNRVYRVENRVSPGMWVAAPDEETAIQYTKGRVWKTKRPIVRDVTDELLAWDHPVGVAASLQAHLDTDRVGALAKRGQVIMGTKFVDALRAGRMPEPEGKSVWLLDGQEP